MTHDSFTSSTGTHCIVEGCVIVDGRHQAAGAPAPSPSGAPATNPAEGDPWAQFAGGPRRDRFGRPLILTTEGKEEAYQRATTFAGLLADRFGIEKWKTRMVAAGIATRPDLAAGAHAAHLAGDKRTLQAIADQAMEAVGSSAKATVGTALHSFCESVDRGSITLGEVPETYRADVAAYVKAMAPYLPLGIEEFGVHDGLKVAGTWDRIIMHPTWTLPRIADIKTGSIDLSGREIGLQLTIYSRCQKYDHASGARTPLIVDQDKAVVIHLPAGEGRCDLFEVDLDPAGVELAEYVRRWRSVKPAKTRIGGATMEATA